MLRTRNDMAQRLDDKLAREAPPPKGGKKAYLIIYDGGHARAVKGFGLRVTQAGARSWVLNYRTAGVERRLTIGSFPDWKAGPARDEAARLKRLVDQGRDPMRERHELRGAPTVKNLADRYLAEHAIKKRTGDADKAMIVKIIVPALGNRKVADVQFTDIDKLHRDVSKCTPIRVAALLSKMFSLAIKWQIRETNPCKGIERNHEDKRERYLSPDEMARLVAALNASKAPGVNAIRLALLTGARRGEILSMRWEDIREGTWVKPSAHTKQKKEHRLPISAPVQQLLSEMRTEAERKAKKSRTEPSRYVFPNRNDGDRPAAEIKKAWAVVCKAANLQGVRFHDLRHQHASILASGGASLPAIGALLGHTQPSTTARYVHLFSDPLRKAVEKVGAVVGAAAGGKPAAKVVNHRAAGS